MAPSQPADGTPADGRCHLQRHRIASPDCEHCFTAAGEPVVVRQGGAIFFTGIVTAAPPGVGDGVDDNDDNGEDDGGGTPVEVVLTRSAAAPSGSKAEAPHFPPATPPHG